MRCVSFWFDPCGPRVTRTFSKRHEKKKDRKIHGNKKRRKSPQEMKVKKEEEEEKKRERRVRNSTGCRQRNKTPRCLVFFSFFFFVFYLFFSFYSLATRNGGTLLYVYPNSKNKFFFFFSYLFQRKKKHIQILQKLRSNFFFFFVWARNFWKYKKFLLTNKIKKKKCRTCWPFRFFFFLL